MLDGKVKNSNYPLLYHITPESGLLNDPNGLIKFKDEYHVFYQWNPFGTEHKNKCWGHVSSNDLVHWKRQPIALQPSESYDKDGIYSGSAIQKDNLLYLFYTGNVYISEAIRESYQCVAVSEDGIHFKKLGPIIKHPSGYTRHVRDPKLWQDSTGMYWMILGAQKENLSGDVLLYHSLNLIDWEASGSLIYDSPKLGYMWECPDLLRFPQKDCLLFSPQGLLAEKNKFENINQTGYYLGKFSKSGTFIRDEADFEELDRGFEFYAPQTFFADDRIILFGWLGAMPELEEQQTPTIKEGWVHTLTIPREVQLSGGKLRQKPVDELKILRDLENSFMFSSELPSYTVNFDKPFIEIDLQFNENISDFTINISNSFWIKHKAESKEIKIQRKNWVSGNYEQRIGFYDDQLLDCKIYLDGSTIEAFFQTGNLVFSSRYFVEDSLARSIIFTGDLKNISGELYPLALN